MDDSFERVIAGFAQQQHGIVTLAQVRASGGSRIAIDRRIRSGRWHSIDRGVYAVAGAPATWHQSLLASVLAVGNGAVAAGRSAAALLRLPGFAGGPIEVVVLRPCQRRARRGSTRQTKLLPLDHCTAIEQIPVTSVPRTLFDLAATLHPGRVERAIDHALAQRLVPVHRLWDTFLDLAERGRSGTVVMRALLLERGPGYVAPASELEARFLQLLRGFGLPGPDRQVSLGDAEGLIGRVDFRFRAAGLVVETDGRRYHSALLDRELDERRDRRLEAIGHQVLRLTWKDIVEHPAECAALVAGRLSVKAA